MRLRYILIFAVLTLIYFQDAVFKNLLLAVGDGLLEFYPLKVVFMDMVKEGALPLWNPYMFIGFPFMASMQAGAFYPLNWLLLPFSPESAFNLSIFAHISLSGYFMFLYVRLIVAKDFPSVMAGVVFAFLGFISAHLHQPPIQATAAWLPLILYFIEKLRITFDIRYSLLGGIAIAFQVYAGHPQTLLLSGMLIFLYVIFHGLHMGISRGFKFLLKSLISAGVGIALSLPQLIATFELTNVAFRAELSYEIFSQLSMPFHMLVGLIFPFFREPMIGFIGILPFVIACIAIFKEWRSNLHVRVFGIIAVISLLLSLGANIPPLHKLMYHVPAYNLFRAPVRHLYEFDFALTVIFAFGISRLMETGGKAKSGLVPKLIMIALLLIVFSEALYFRAGQNLSFQSISEVKNRQETRLLRFLKENKQTTVFIFTSRGDNTQDLLPITKRIPMLNGYDPLIIKDLSDLLDMEGIGYSHEWDELIKNNIILSMLGTKYLIVPKDKELLMEAVTGRVTDKGYMPPIGLGLPPSKEYQRIYERLFYSERGILYLNRNCLPTAWSVIELIEAESIDDVSIKLYAFRIDPRRQAMLSKKDIERIGLKTFSQGSAKIVSSKPNKLILNTDFTSTGFIVLSEQFYPNWSAYIDGLPTEIYKTNGVMRGVVVPSGKHKLIFRYIPVKIYMAMALSGIAIGAIFLIIFYRPKNKNDIDN